MKIDIKKAYDYYVNNINKSCDNRVLDEKSFHEAFPAFLQQLSIDEVMHSNSQHIPIYNDKCKTSRIVNLETVLKKDNMKYQHKITMIDTNEDSFDYHDILNEFFFSKDVIEKGQDWEKVKTPILTSEDGVELYEGDKCVILFLDNWTIYSCTLSDRIFEFSEHLIFSIRKAAENYIENNKPVLSFRDVWSIIKDCHEMNMNGIKKELQNLVKSKL